MVELKELVQMLSDKHIGNNLDSIDRPIDQLRRFEEDVHALELCIFNSYVLAERELYDEKNLEGKSPEILCKGVNAGLFGGYAMKISKLTGVAYSESKDFVDAELTKYLTLREVWYNVGLKYHDLVTDKKDTHAALAEIALKLGTSVENIENIFERDCIPAISRMDELGDGVLSIPMGTNNITSLVGYAIGRGGIKSGAIVTTDGSSLEKIGTTKYHSLA